MNRQKHILLIGLAHAGAGLTRVLSEFGKGLVKEDYEISFLGYRYNRNSLTTLHPDIRHIDWPYGLQDFSVQPEFAELVKEVRPDLVFIIGAPWTMRFFLESLRSFRDQLKVMLYFPIEGRLSDKNALPPLMDADHVLLYTQFAQNNLSSLLSDFPQTNSHGSIPDINTLAHGVDTKAFFPLTKNTTSKVQIRKELFPHRPDLWDAFIVLNANQPYHRKRLDLTIKGFAQFAQDKTNAFLYLHALSMDKYSRQKINRWTKEAGVTDQILVNSLNPEKRPVSEELLNNLYNACDVGINTAMGEGWGLVSFEHAATGAPQIIPAHSVFLENWEGAGVFMKTGEPEYYWFQKSDSFPVKVDEVTRCLEKLYFDKEYRFKMGDKAYQHATSSQFKWEVIVKKLDRFISSALSVNTKVINSDS